MGNDEEDCDSCSEYMCIVYIYCITLLNRSLKCELNFFFSNCTFSFIYETEIFFCGINFISTLTRFSIKSNKKKHKLDQKKFSLRFRLKERTVDEQCKILTIRY